MDAKTFSKIRRRMKLDKDRNADFAAYDDMDDVSWEFPFRLRTWERKQVSTAPHDALKTAYNIFDTNQPKWEILPYYGPKDKDKAEERERWLEWNMMQANQHGDGEPFRKVLHHSSKYNMIAAQLEYLPYWLPPKKEQWSKEQNAAMQNGPFCITLHHPGTVYYQYGKYVLQWVARVVNVEASDVLEHWGVYASDKTDDGKVIKKAIGKLVKMLEDDDEARVILVDYSDYDKRSVVCWLTSGTTVSDTDMDTPPDEMITIYDGENTLSFINWVIVSGDSTPLLYSIHKGAIWENTNLIKTIKTSNILRRGYSAIYKHRQGPSGKAMEVDFSSADPVIELAEGVQGEDVDVMQPQLLDPGFATLDAENQGEMAMSTGVRQLQAMESPSNVQYATINAMIQLAMSQLEPYTRNAEKAMIGLAKLAFLWVAETGDTVRAYRMNTESNTRPQAQQIAMSRGKFDPEQLFISCKFTPNAPTDKMQLISEYVRYADTSRRTNPVERSCRTIAVRLPRTA